MDQVGGCFNKDNPIYSIQPLIYLDIIMVKQVFPNLGLSSRKVWWLLGRKGTLIILGYQHDSTHSLVNQVSSQLISENYRQRQYLTKFCRNDLLLISALYSLLFSSRSRDTFLRNQVVDNVKTELSRWFSFMLSNGDLK